MRSIATLCPLILLACGSGAGGGGPDGGDDDDPDGSEADDDGPKSDDADDTSWWQPAPGVSWQWQLTGSIVTSLDVEMYDLDLDAVGDVIDELHADGRIVICYFSAGSVEDWRTDVGDLPDQAIGNVLDGWPDEHWLDIRHPAVRALATSRIERAAALGCDGVEPDNVDGFDNDPGFALTAGDQLEFNRFLATTAHASGISVGLKNDLDQVPELLADFDWALNESCMDYDECDKLVPFITAGKAVFHVEYGGSQAAICALSNQLGFDTLIKDDDVGPVHVSCD